MNEWKTEIEAYGPVESLESKTNLNFISIDLDVEKFKEFLIAERGFRKGELERLKAFFVDLDTSKGEYEYTELYAIESTIPDNSRLVYQLKSIPDNRFNELKSFLESQFEDYQIRDQDDYEDSLFLEIDHDSLDFEHIHLSKERNKYGALRYNLMLNQFSEDDLVVSPEILAQDYQDLWEYDLIQEQENAYTENGKTGVIHIGEYNGIGIKIFQVRLYDKTKKGWEYELYSHKLDKTYNSLFESSNSNDHAKDLDQAIEWVNDTMVSLIEDENDKEIEDHKNEPTKEFSYMGKTVKFYPTLHDKTCYCNITHEHYYLGYTLEFETNDIEDIKPFFHLRDTIIHILSIGA